MKPRYTREQLPFWGQYLLADPAVQLREAELSACDWTLLVMSERDPYPGLVALFPDCAPHLPRSGSTMLAGDCRLQHHVPFEKRVQVVMNVFWETCVLEGVPAPELHLLFMNLEEYRAGLRAMGSAPARYVVEDLSERLHLGVPK